MVWCPWSRGERFPAQLAPRFMRGHCSLAFLSRQREIVRQATEALKANLLPNEPFLRVSNMAAKCGALPECLLGQWDILALAESRCQLQQFLDVSPARLGIGSSQSLDQLVRQVHLKLGGQ